MEILLSHVGGPYNENTVIASELRCQYQLSVTAGPRCLLIAMPFEDCSVELQSKLVWEQQPSFLHENCSSGALSFMLSRISR